MSEYIVSIWLFLFIHHLVRNFKTIKNQKMTDASKKDLMGRTPIRAFYFETLTIILIAVLAFRHDNVFLLLLSVVFMDITKQGITTIVKWERKERHA